MSNEQPNQAEKIRALKDARNKAIAEAEKAAYAYFCECEVGQERIRASDIYDNVRTALRIGY
jgi:predicted SprT family Zn-dependent metalloprotease